MYRLFLLFVLLLVSFNVFAFPNVPQQHMPEPTFFQAHAPEFVKGFSAWLQEMQEVVNREIPKFMKTLKEGENTAGMVWAFVMAFAYGVFHTIGPGHGKLIVSTYFLTREAQYMKGVTMGGLFSLAHVGGAIAIVFITDLSLRTMIFNPEEKMFWVKIISYGGVFLVALYMMAQVVRHFIATRKIKKVEAPMFGVQNSPMLTPHIGCAHCARQQEKMEKGELDFLSVFAGAVPCTGSLLILLYAMAHDILFLGILMVLMVALGMAVTMTIIGIVAIFFQKFYVGKIARSEHSAHRVKLVLEFLGALFLLMLSSTLMLLTL